MLAIMISQIALAAASVFGPTGVPPATSHHPIVVSVTAGPDDKNALDILNNTRPDILGRGAAHRCSPVTAVYVNGRRRLAPAIDHGFSRATFYFAGDSVMIMLPPSVADALRTVPAKAVRDIRYTDCRAEVPGGEKRNTLWIVTN